MNEIKIHQKNGLSFFILSIFFFFRTAFLVPTDCFGIYYHEPHFNVTIYSVSFLILLILFSVLSSFFALTVQKSFGILPAVLFLLMISDPLYFVLQDDNLKLTATIILLLFAYYFVSKKPSNMHFIYPAIFLSSFIFPSSVFCYIPLIIFAFISIKIKKISTKNLFLCILLQICFAIFGYALHKFLYSEFESFKALIDNFSFADLNNSNDKLPVISAIIPMLILCFIFSNIFIKQNKRLLRNKIITKDESVTGIFFLDGLGIIYAIIIAGFIIFDFQNISVANLILPFFIFIMSITDNTTCKSSLNIVVGFINKYKLLSFGIFLLVYYISYKTIYVCIGYPTLVSYIRF